MTNNRRSTFLLLFFFFFFQGKSSVSLRQLLSGLRSQGVQSTLTLPFFISSNARSLGGGPSVMFAGCYPRLLIHSPPGHPQNCRGGLCRVIELGFYNPLLDLSANFIPDSARTFMNENSFKIQLFSSWMAAIFKALFFMRANEKQQAIFELC